MSASKTVQTPAEREKDSKATTGPHQQQQQQQQQPRLKKRKRFPHGNYTGYYSTRYGTDAAPASDHSANTADATSTTTATVTDAGADASPEPAPEPVGARDPRLGLMRRSWFEGKKCLDVGCNEGHLTLALVRSFRPRRMVGIDIDGYLVQRARRALVTEISKGTDADARAAFRPLMPRSLRGGGGGGGSGGGRVLATPAVDARLRGGKVEGADNGAAQRARHEECAAGAGSGDTNSNGDADGGAGAGAGSNEAAMLEDCRKVKGRDRRKGGAPEAEGSTVPPKVPGSDTSSGVKNGGSSVGATNCDTSTTVRRGGGAGSAPPSEEERAPFGGGTVSDTVKDGGSATAAAAAAAVAAVGAVADPADATVLSGCAVLFRHEDFVNEAHGDHRYDVVCLFSVVKWMHLNGGDEAIRDVFQKAYGLLRPGGRLILEPQPWKSYRKSARQHGSAEARANVGTIKLRPPDFPALLTDEVGFRSWEAVGSPAEGVGGFAKRGVHVFLKG